ncbi:MAG: hypothetical protein IKO40_00910, partial [Kiritimatiellae bacterium]|nr:hypothetical protein [Kiritimatiellia bacterium]
MNHPTKALRAAAAIVAVAAVCSLATADSIRFLADTYLESDGSQAIDTGIRPTTNMTVEVEFSPLAAPGTTWLFGSISDASSMAYGVYLQGSTVHFAGGAHGGTINYWDTSVKTTASRFKSVYNFATRRVYLYSGDTELFSGWGVQIAAPAVATNELTLALFCHHGYQMTYSDRFT